MQISNLLKKNLFNLFIIIIIFFLDRVSKYFILEYFKIFGQQDFALTSFLNFNLVWNDGIAFGLLQLNNGLFYNLITILIISILFIVTWFAYNSTGLNKISYLMIIGGGAGNIFDRIYYGSVIDFIDLNYENFHWFIFNVADMFITLGILILIISEFVKK